MTGAVSSSLPATARLMLGLVLPWSMLSARPAMAGSDDEPILYSKTAVHDPVARLQEQIDRGELKLNYDDAHGYLSSVLAALKIPASSQTLVFSKTSFQRNLISPHKPRALYFNDDVYIGWVREGSVLEVASMDRRQGTLFYTLKQEKSAKPRFVRQTYDCLQCHESGMSQGVPGLLMRSVYPDEEGQPILSAGTFVSSDQSPWRQRWGGWYVTGTHGGMRHMGNVILADEEHPEQLDVNFGANLTDLCQRIKTAPYLAPTSDIVALMVLEHQTNLHNLMTKADYETRIALRDQQAMNQALKEKPDYRSPSTTHRIQSACEPLVRAMLFAGEAKLTYPVQGTSAFAREFATLGPFDKEGRSLRQFDLTRRLFKYPCSYLIYSEQFDALPAEAKSYVYRRLWEVLNGSDTSTPFSSLTEQDRSAILQILRESKRDLPGYWR
jgi:hypothetical protein